MQYSNPQIPEGINTSKSHPLKEFILLTGGVMAALMVLIVLLVMMADLLTAYIPYSVEKNVSMSSVTAEERHGPLTDYLQSLSDRIAHVEQLPQEMKITIHYMDEDTINAFATLGGNVIVFRGLLEKLPNENALAMLLAHEIAHIKHRHPVKSLGRGVIVGLALSVISTSISDAVLQQFMGSAGTLGLLKYNREMETQADETAVQAVRALFGHLHGANDLFEILQQETGQSGMPEFLSTHPLTESRISNINAHTAQASSEQGEISPLPEAFFEWVENRD